MEQVQLGSPMAYAVIERLQQAQNAHDLEAFLACFAPNIQSDHPVHPERAFQGIEHVRKNWSAMFHNIPDFRSELLRSAVEGDTIWAEWHWFGTDRNGTRFGVRGVSILGIQADQIEWARFYMEPESHFKE
jgi:ketosteroid isomerase-like protein